MRKECSDRRRLLITLITISIPSTEELEKKVKDLEAELADLQDEYDTALA